METQTFTVDELTFELRTSSRRKSMEIIVDRDGQLRLAAPDDCKPQLLMDFVREKRLWIFEKLAEKNMLFGAQTPKEYVDGEGLFYLGRSHRLLLVDAQKTPVKLERGRFRMRRKDASEGMKHMIRWYKEHDRPWLLRRVGLFKNRLEVDPQDVAVRDLGYRWGSCGKGDVLYFHWKTILLPPRIIDYVLVHEMSHLHEPNHTNAFWQRVERAMTDYEERKSWLAENGINYYV
ncbi:MAG: SprT family zinc-dependent metalloprotease [Myxococcota bacterium]